MEFRNGTKMRKNVHKPGLSGCSRNDAFSLCEKWGLRDCLIPVDVDVIQEIKQEMGGDAILDFVTSDFAACARTAFDALEIVSLEFDNVWDIFVAMFPLCFPVDDS